MDRLLTFAAGEPSHGLRAEIEAHLDECAHCRCAVSDLVRGTVPEPRLGRYQLETVLGGGGMGIVYRAFDPLLARAVAIKVVNTAGDDESLRSRLELEARSLARLSHPNVCQVYDVGRERDEVWVAMELLDGIDLRLWAATRPTGDIEAALVAAARGLAAAHGVGLIHRDVKPENVLVARDGRVVVTDFGLAQPVASAVSSRSARGVVSGTPAYLGPEQLTASPLDARVDQFAWAVMAWELLVGERPFPVDPVARLAAIRSGIARPRDLEPRLSGVLIRALAIAPRDRFASMDALVSALLSPARAPRWRRPRAAAAWALAVASAVFVAMKTVEPGGHGAGAATQPAEAPRHTAPPPATAPASPGSAAALAPPPATVPEQAHGLATPAAPAPRESSPPPGRGARTPAIAAAARAGAPVPPHTGSAAGPPPPPPPADHRLTTPSVPAADRPAPDPAPPEPAPVAGPAAPRDPPRSRFDAARAERRLADCRFPVDPARLERALVGLGVAVDWGPITRREVVRGPGRRPRLMYEVEGSRDVYHFDGAGLPELGTLDAAIGELVVVCPYALPPRSPAADGYPMPAYWRVPAVPIYAFAPAAVTPRIASDLSALAPLHVPESALRDLVSGISPALAKRPLLVWAMPTTRTDTSWEMKGWTLDITGMKDLADLGAEGPLWFVVDRPRVEGSPGSGHPVLHGVVALRSLLR